MLYTLHGKEITIDPYEVLRYLGYVRDKITDTDVTMVADCVHDALNALTPKACYERYPVTVMDDGHIMMPYGEIVSSDLAKCISGCSEVYIFAATVGVSYDRYIRQQSARSMAKGAVVNSIGAAAVENLCDRLNAELERISQEKGERLKPRYSPGYGDLALINQKGIFDILSPDKNIGLTLKDNMIMSPEKSVTAIIGIENR